MLPPDNEGGTDPSITNIYSLVWSDYETSLRLLESDTQLQYVDKHKTTVVLSAPGDGCKSFLTGSGSFCPDSEFIDRNRIF